MASQKLNKNSQLINIFETMEYGTVSETWNLALGWLAERNNTFGYAKGNAEENFTTIKPKIKEDLLIKIISNTDDDVEQTTEKCKTQLKTWSTGTGRQRGKLLNSLSTELIRHETLICQLEMIIRNILPKDTKNKSLPILTDYIRYYAGWAYTFETHFYNGEPYGICACILSNDIPLSILSFIIAPVLAAGNAIILQTGIELTPLAFLLAQICHNVGFPEGLVNVVISNTDYIMKHKDIKKIICTGDMLSDFYMNMNISLDKSLTTLHLGNAAMIIFDNADIDSACDAIPDAVWACNGKLPWSVSKLYVQESIFEEFVEKLELKLEKLNVGHIAHDKMLDVVIPKSPDVQNSKFKLINNLPLIIGYKVFGSNVILPEENTNILTVLPFRTANEVATLVNNSRFGFAASVWTENIGVANELTSKLKVGIVWINIHGYINACASFSPYKSSGCGVFGAEIGLNEYLSHSTMCMFSGSPTTKSTIKSQLPSPITNKRTYLYYGGSFKRSESCLTESDYELPNRKDIRNCVEIAKKGYEIWSKLQPKVRGQYLLKLADGSVAFKINSTTNEYWINFLYEWMNICDNLKSLVQDGRPTLKVLKEPLGVIGLDSYAEPNIFSLKLIAAALATGNAVIIVNYSEEGQQFLSELCKIMSATGIPTGVFNVISNPNASIYDNLINHREIEAYYTCKTESNVNMSVRQRLKNIRNVTDSNNYILSLVTANKCVWTSTGESFL